MKNAAQAEVAHLEAEIKPVNDAITEMKSEIQSLQTCLSDHVRSHSLNNKNINIKYKYILCFLQLEK